MCINDHIFMMSKTRAKYFVKEACGTKCSKRCTEKFTHVQREEINEEFWSKSWRERRLFIRNCSDLLISKRRVKENPQRKQRKTFYLTDLNGERIHICKTFLLTTLGFKKTNDRVLYNSLNDNRTNISEINDRRGKHKKPFIVDRELLKAHVESFQPKPSLYSKDQQCVTHYLPSNITIKCMYDDIRIKYPNMKISYDLYRKNLKTLNISFTHVNNEPQEDKKNMNILDTANLQTQLYHHNCYSTAQEMKLDLEMYRDHTAVGSAHLVKPEQYLTQTFQMQIPEQPLNHYQTHHVMMSVPPLHTPHPTPTIPTVEPVALLPPLPPPPPPDLPQTQTPVQYTKSGTVRLRKKYDSSLEERIAQKKNRIRSKYLVREGCDDKCTKKCTEKFSEAYRHQINKEFWEKSWSERRLFIRNCSDLVDSKRRIKGKQKRRDRKTFSLTSETGDKVQVCKIFLLTTLGFKKNNDRVLYNSLKDKRINVSEICDGRGRYTKTPTVDRELLKAHVESFQPRLSLYNEELVPLKKYLPNDITVKAMYNDFREKYPSIKVSYDLYRKNIKSLNISFTRRGGEDCQLYGAFEMGWTDLQQAQG